MSGVWSVRLEKSTCSESTDVYAEGAENMLSPCQQNCPAGDCIGGMVGEGQDIFGALLTKVCTLRRVGQAGMIFVLVSLQIDIFLLVISEQLASHLTSVHVQVSLFRLEKLYNVYFSAEFIPQGLSPKYPVWIWPLRYFSCLGCNGHPTLKPAARSNLQLCVEENCLFFNPCKDDFVSKEEKAVPSCCWKNRCKQRNGRRTKEPNHENTEVLVLNQVVLFPYSDHAWNSQVFMRTKKLSELKYSWLSL